MNRTKHMKHKKNTRRRHNPRNKTRKPRNTHKKYNRCRTRRGGNPKEKVYDEVLSEILKKYEVSIPQYFINYDTFNNFLTVYGKDVLKQAVCGKFSIEDIRVHTATQLDIMKRKLISDTSPTPKTIRLTDLVLTQKFINSWTDFVISLKTTVDARSSSDSDISIKQRMTALEEDPLKPQPPPPQLHPGLAIPLPNRVLRPASIIPGSEVDKRPYPPPGFTLQGNVWIGPNTVVPEDFYKKPPAPAAPASPAPAPPAPAPREPLTGEALRAALFSLRDD